MAANLSDNLNITKAPPVGAFALRRYDRGIREGALHQYPCRIAELTRYIRSRKILMARYCKLWFIACVDSLLIQFELNCVQ